MSLHVRDIADSRVNIPPRKSWICFNEIGLCGPVAKLPEDQLHSYPSSTNHRLPQHYFRIDFNSISGCHSGLNVDRFHLGIRISGHVRNLRGPRPRRSTSRYRLIQPGYLAAT